jgi:Transposase DDE domain group 1
LTDHNTTQCVLFPNLSGKPVVARFDSERGSSDGGAILLKAAAERLGLIERLSTSLQDRRDPERVRHEINELVAQRVFGIACGYADGNDAARLACDPVHKLLVGRDPIDGDALASQPTLSRFENAVGPRELYRMGEALADVVIDRHRKRLGRRVKRITIDLDPTDDPTHGQQQLTMFNGHYDTWCYLPVVAFVTFNDEPEQYLAAAVLRPGNAHAKLGAAGILRRLLVRLRTAFPRARFLVRLDGGFACQEVLDFLDGEPKLNYVVAMAKNLNLERSAERWMPSARKRSRESGETAHVYGATHYQAKKWPCKRRVIIKAEVVRHPGREPKENPRFVITNLLLSPQWIYEKVYCGRGEIENRIKELHHGLEIDRTSCSRFWANQFRVLLTAAAYVLMQELRLAAKGTHCARAQVNTLRERLLKIGARVVVSCRRIVLHLPRFGAALHAWARIANNLGAVSP